MTMPSCAKIQDLLNKTFLEVYVKKDKYKDDELFFVSESGETYKFYHSQDCCESVYIEDIIGNLNDLVGSPILMAEEVTNKDENPEGVKVPEYQDSFTWTFYKFATIKGYVTIRWYGESNGFYSESVDFCKVN